MLLIYSAIFIADSSRNDFSV